MAMIYVRAKQGRAAFYQGRVIPTDKFIPVTDDPYMRRLAHHWEDVEIEGGEAPPEGEQQQSRRDRRRHSTPEMSDHPHGMPNRPKDAS
jgi:hypothetical protein